MSDNGAQPQNVPDSKLMEQGEPIIVSKEDRLESEVLHLKILNHTHVMQQLVADMQAMRKQQMEMQSLLIENKKYLEEKYKLNLDTHEISEQDGTVRQKQAPGGQFQQMLNAVGQRRSPGG